MTLPVSGPISLNMVNVELGLSGTTLISLDQASVRTLAGVPSGTISLNNLYGKSNRVTITVNYTSSTSNANVAIMSQPGYIAGKTDLVINVNAGVYLYGSNEGFPGLEVFTFNLSDTVTVNNYGYILGGGGSGGDAGQAGNNGNRGLYVISSGTALTVNNYSGAYIAGGGGGGAGGNDGAGGGGAGGGFGGSAGGNARGSGGGIGATGSNGAFSGGFFSGGGGGRVFPGSRAAPSTAEGIGGTAGGSGGGTSLANYGGYGGGPGEAGQSNSVNIMFGDLGGAGGGGWGAAGGNVNTSLGVLIRSGGLAGNAIYKGSAAFTLNNSGTIYGAVV